MDVFLKEQGLVLAKLLGAFALAVIVGWEREVHHKLAGVRAHILVAIGACAFAQCGLLLFDKSIASGAHSTDAIRVLQAVTSGIGFLAAGVIIQHGSRVQGLTTAIGLWATASIGLAVGIGAIGVAVFATGITYAVLRLKPLVRQLEQRHECDACRHGRDHEHPTGEDDDADEDGGRARRRVRGSQSVSTNQ